MKKRVQMVILKWLRFWARLQLKKFAPDMIGITGSAGKTSAKNAVFAVLKDKYRTKMTGKANSESGIPLDILGINPNDYSMADWLRMVVLAPIKLLTNWQPYEKYVVEMAVDSPAPPKNMEYLLTILKPRTAIWLNVLPTHTQFFPDGEAGITREKGKLVESLPKNGLAILNAGDPRVIEYRDKTKAQVMTFGENEAEVCLTGWEVNGQGTRFEFNHQFMELPGYILPKHLGLTFAAALCLAIDEDYTLEEGINLIKRNWHLEPGRSSLIEGINESLIIDSSYNASPGPMTDMLELLRVIPGKRKLALLGEMRELGTESANAHRKVVALAKNIASEVFLVGESFKEMPGWCKNATEAAGKIHLGKGDVLMVKGSQNTIFLETAVEKLMAYPEQADRLLCRRGKYWDRLRNSV